MINALKTWFEDAWWSWGNAIHFRIDRYEDNIDRCAFFYEINIGWYDMYDQDDIGDRDPWNLFGRVTHLKVPEEDFDAMIKALDEPPKYMIGLANLMKSKLPND